LSAKADLPFQGVASLAASNQDVAQDMPFHISGSISIVSGDGSAAGNLSMKHTPLSVSHHPSAHDLHQKSIKPPSLLKAASGLRYEASFLNIQELF
jgi:hypothetical protein